MAFNAQTLLNTTLKSITKRLKESDLVVTQPKVSDENRYRASKPLYPCRPSRAGFPLKKWKILDSHVVLDKALGLLEYSGRRGAGFGVRQCTFKSNDKRATKAELFRVQSHLEFLMQRGIHACKLFLDIPSRRLVGLGKVHNTLDVMLHSAHRYCNRCDALLPIPLDEDIFTLGGAIGTYVAWLIDLVDVVSTMEKKDSRT
ncbi:hypothetical protein Lal_00002624 [Lupinus albus]|nr:hypothetical protein Lal_00002624 [Lupinus albus]